ncbi:hypothetical protein RN001_004759 [Aquatica leii]|uniref:Major facilitator superfamily (MFS) profile domain-containing protein n=1 Tax=Aquatica leii TaxID=1421715 RepID=A0AAN7P5R9_9COLE|nr:hypothetical protein RN001_004759 [Aquatica leii]
MHLQETFDLDAALTIIGYGKFHYKIMVACALCFISSGVQYGLTAYAMPAAHCELNLSSPQIGIINSSFLIGAIFSSFLWGVIADSTGRKKLLITTLLLDSAVTVCCALSQSANGIIACRFINGFLVGAPGSVTFSYMAEFHAPAHRAKTIYYAGVFFTIPWLILPALAWCILTLKVDVVLGDFIFISPWRIFLMILALPELLGGIWLIQLPETPKFLSATDTEKALKVLHDMYEMNTKNNKETFPIKRIVKNLQVHDKLKPNVKMVNNDKLRKLVFEIFIQMFTLFKAPLRKSTTLITSIMFSNMFGYFGLGLWLPEVLVRKQENVTNNITNSTDYYNNTCSFNFDTNLYQNTVIIGITALIANILAGWLSGKVTKNAIPLVMLVLGAICSAWIYWVDNEFQYLIASCIFQSSMSVANIAISSVAVELFPTNVNAIGICATMLAGRLGAIVSNTVFGFFIDKNPAVAIFLIIGILLFGAFLCLFISNSEKTEIEILNKSKTNPIFCITKN